MLSGTAAPGPNRRVDTLLTPDRAQAVARFGRSSSIAAGGSQAVAALSAAFRQTKRDKGLTGRHLAGCRGERAVCAALSTLALEGVQHLDDRRWRADGEAKANIDHLVVGPAGVFVVDAKNWAGRIDVRGNHLLQDGQPVDHRLIALAAMTNRVTAVLDGAGIPVRPQSLICFTGTRKNLSRHVGRVALTDETSLGAWLAQRPRVLDAQQISDVLEVLAYAFPAYDLDPRELAEAHGVLFSDDETRHAGLMAATSLPMPEWTVWLHPEQATVARRSFTGPARVRGAAGTGKTSVALHRVAWLACTRPGRFLVTSFVKSLPPMLEQGYAHLSPQTADRVDFVHVHRVAIELLRERGRGVRATPGNEAFQVAWERHRHGLTGEGLSHSYFREEVDHVLKGRGLTSLEEYLVLDRVGRGTPLQAEARRRVWALRETYDEELARRGECDFTDVLRLARDEARRSPYARWVGVVVDEAQDIPLVGLQLLHELAGRDRPDGLLVVGDGQQAIYPGGYRLVDAGISVAGRASVLRTNYRNTVEILAAAAAVVAEDAYDDLETASGAGTRDVEVVRHGELPSITSYDSVNDHDAALLWDLQAHGDRGTPWSDLAVLCPTNKQATDYQELLEAHGVPAVLLSSSKALRTDAVKLGTWFRAKGMEFAHVYLPQANRRTMHVTGAGTAAQAEKELLLRRTQFVAMTRARNTLWVGRLR